MKLLNRKFALFGLAALAILMTGLLLTGNNVEAQQSDIKIRLANTGSMDLTEGNNLELDVIASRPVPATVYLQMALAGATDSFTTTGNVRDVGGIYYDPIPAGGTRGKITITTIDDDVVEQDETATGTLTINTTGSNISVDSNRNSFTLRHWDDDYQIVDIYNNALYLWRELSFPVEVHLLPSGSASYVDVQVSANSRMEEITLSGGRDAYQHIFIRTPAGFTRNSAWYDLTNSGARVVGHNYVLPAPKPEVSITAGSGITEGGNATFTVTASPAPSSALSVRVRITQSGNYGVSAGLRTVTIPTSGSNTLAIPTRDDSQDEADGSVTATVNTGSAYTVSASAGSATVAVADDDEPRERSQGSGQSEQAGQGGQVCESQLPNDAITVSEVTGWRDALDSTKAAAGIKRWNRVLAKLGENTGQTPMTAQQARGVANWLGNTRWDRTARTLEAMEQCDN